MKHHRQATAAHILHAEDLHQRPLKLRAPGPASGPPVGRHQLQRLEAFASAHRDVIDHHRDVSGVQHRVGAGAVDPSMVRSARGQVLGVGAEGREGLHEAPIVQVVGLFELARSGALHRVGLGVGELARDGSGLGERRPPQAPGQHRDPLGELGFEGAHRREGRHDRIAVRGPVVGAFHRGQHHGARGQPVARGVP